MKIPKTFKKLTEKDRMKYAMKKKQEYERKEYKLVFHPFIDFIGGDKQMQYVHQLQNLYFALTGEELMIEDLQLNGASQRKLNR